MFRDNVVVGSTSRLKFVNHNESYGRHILAESLSGKNIQRCLDIGCGKGDDLEIVKKINPGAELHGIDFGEWNRTDLESKGIAVISINIEKEALPFPDEYFDFIIINQTLEHTKEIYWINHEVFRCLKIGGELFLGVPNVLSFHNRILGLFGTHPTNCKMISAHIRPFSKKDFCLFYNTVGKDFVSIERFWGAQFYPFPPIVSRALASVLPSCCFSIFFLLKKIGQYSNQFLLWPKKSNLETNFFLGGQR